MRLQTKYMMLKATTIFFGALSIPWSTYTGYCFGDGRYTTGLISLAAQTLIAFIDGYIWFWVLENMKNKIQGEAGLTGVSASHLETCPLLSRERKPAGGVFQQTYPVSSNFSSEKEILRPETLAHHLSLNNTGEQSR